MKRKHKESGVLNKKNVRDLFKQHGKQIGNTSMNALEELMKGKIVAICDTMGSAIKRISVSDILSLQNINKKKKRLVKRSVL